MFGSPRTTTTLIGLALVAMLLAGAPPTTAQLSVDTTPLSLGKVDPGHTSVHTHTVSNQDEAPIDVLVQVECPCDIYVNATPAEFTLGPGASQDITITVDVPLSAGPGIHDNTVRVVALRETGSGGMAQSASAITAAFQVRTAHVYLDPVTDPAMLSTRFVNAYDAPLSVTYQGTIVTPEGQERTLGPFTTQADGSGSGSQVARLDLPLGLDTDSTSGIYTVDLHATWSDPSGQITGTQDLAPLDVAVGAMVQLRDLSAERDGSVITVNGLISNLGNVPAEVYLVAEFTTAEGRSHTVEGLPMQLDAGATKSIFARWADADPNQAYSVGAHAVYAGAASQTSKTGQSTLLDVPVGDAVEQDASSDSHDSTDTGSIANGGTGYTIIGVVALVGIGIGALVGILINRSGRDP